jgi:hypothetical protein
MKEFQVNPLVSPGAGPVPGVPQHQPSNLFRFGEITLYSTFAFPAGAGGLALANTTNRLFATPLGQQGQGFAVALTVAETNLKEAGRIPSGQAYDVFGVAGQVMGFDATAQTLDLPFNDVAAAGVAPAAGQASIADLQNFVNNTILLWDFTQTQVFICPLMLAGAGGGLFGAFGANAAAASGGSMGNGNGGIWMYRRHPVALPGNSTFAVLAQIGGRAAGVLGANNGMALRVVLLGYYKSVIEIG